MALASRRTYKRSLYWAPVVILFLSALIPPDIKRILFPFDYILLIIVAVTLFVLNTDKYSDLINTFDVTEKDDSLHIDREGMATYKIKISNLQSIKLVKHKIAEKKLELIDSRGRKNEIIFPPLTIKNMKKLEKIVTSVQNRITN